MKSCAILFYFFFKSSRISQRGCALFVNGRRNKETGKAHSNADRSKTATTETRVTGAIWNVWKTKEKTIQLWQRIKNLDHQNASIVMLPDKRLRDENKYRLLGTLKSLYALFLGWGLLVSVWCNRGWREHFLMPDLWVNSSSASGSPSDRSSS